MARAIFPSSSTSTLSQATFGIQFMVLFQRHPDNAELSPPGEVSNAS
jgi:hypothetical protein